MTSNLTLIIGSDFIHLNALLLSEAFYFSLVLASEPKYSNFYFSLSF